MVVLWFCDLDILRGAEVRKPRQRLFGVDCGVSGLLDIR